LASHCWIVPYCYWSCSSQ